MSTSESKTAKPFLERQRDAALQEVREQAADRRRINDLIVGTEPTRDRTGEIIRVGSDYVVEVITPVSTTWATVVGGKRGLWHWQTVDEALLDLVARRRDDNPNNSSVAVFYAARVLGIGQTSAE